MSSGTALIWSNSSSCDAALTLHFRRGNKFEIFDPHRHTTWPAAVTSSSSPALGSVSTSQPTELKHVSVDCARWCARIPDCHIRHLLSSQTSALSPAACDDATEKKEKGLNSATKNKNNVDRIKFRFCSPCHLHLFYFLRDFYFNSTVVCVCWRGLGGGHAQTHAQKTTIDGNWRISANPTLSLFYFLVPVTRNLSQRKTTWLDVPLFFFKRASGKH